MSQHNHPSHPQTIHERDILLIARQWAKRSRHTSVERFIDFFPQARTITSQNALKRPYRVLKWVAGRAAQDGYTSISSGIELSAAWQVLSHRPPLAHFLYADHDYHYLGRFPHARTRLVGTFWFSVEEFERRMPDKSHLARLDLVTASGRRQMDYLSRFVSDERLAYLPLGVETAFFKPPDTPRQWHSEPHLLQMGVNRRDFETLLALFLRLKKHYPDLKLDMVGCPDARPLFPDDPDIIFHPFLDDEQLLAVYHQAAIMVLPLLEGGSSNALNEALAAGLPVVVARMPNLEDYVAESCVTLCPPGDASAMEQACCTLLDNRQRWEAASQAAVRHMRQFDWAVIRQKLLTLYEEKLSLRLVED